MPTQNLSAFFVWSLDSEMQFCDYNQTSFEPKQRFAFLSNTILVRSTDISIIFIFNATNHYYQLIFDFLLLPNRWHASTSFLVSLTFTLSRKLITVSLKSLYLTEWGIPCITTLFHVLYWSELLILVSLFIRAS